MMKILIVDDYNGILETLKYILESDGYKVKTLKNTHNIYSEIDEFNPDLLMLDLLAKGHDGKEICKHLKTKFAFRDLKILIVPGHPKKMENYKSYYADDFIEKPFELNELLVKIKSIMNLHLAQSDKQ
ncbi:MAG: response regulator [Bacteroidota bacterium]|nr:response regulator [Bacteroidota bacterium]